MAKKTTPKAKMTVDEFFKYLASMTHLTEVRKWLRSQDGKTCPITAVCKSKTKAQFDTGDYEKAAKKLGLSLTVAGNIVSGADYNPNTAWNTPRPIVKKYRKKLLEAVRMKEVDQD